MKRLVALFLSLTMLGFLAGCPATMGTCTGPNCTRAEALTTITEMRAQLRILVENGKIPPAKAEEARGYLNSARAAVDTSSGLGTDPLANARVAIAAARQILLTYGATVK